jgi:DNA-binding Lrp family transcriptional regulator
VHKEPSSRRFDEVDRRIVAALQADPRAPWSELGSIVGVSETTVLRRVQRLRESGALIIVGAPDPLRCGLGQPVLLHIRTSLGDAPALAHSLAQRRDVRYASLLTGRSDLMCELMVPNLGYLRRFLMDELPATGVVRSTRSEVVLKRFKTRDQWSHSLLGTNEASPPHPHPAAGDSGDRIGALDEVDTRLIHALSADGRRSYADLSTHVPLSETAIARRLSALTASNKLYFVAMVDPAALGFEIEAMFRVRVVLAELESIALAMARLRQVRYISATSGYSDLVMDVVCEDTEALYEFMSSQVGAIPGVRDVEIDIVLESIKREYRYPLFCRDTKTVASPLLAEESPTTAAATSAAGPRRSAGRLTTTGTTPQNAAGPGARRR